MIAGLAALAWKQVARHPVRSLLTAAGVALGLFLFTVVEAVQASVADATLTRAGEDRLVVFREARYCPSTSRLPASYARRIAEIPGVAEAIPVQIAVSACGAALDIVTWRGVPAEDPAVVRGWRIVSGDLASWRGRQDAAAVGAELAQRRGLRIGDGLGAAGVQALVAAIIDADDPQTRSSAFVHLDFLQRTARTGVGTVTQFDVTVHDPAMLERTAAAIDAAFAQEREPTRTRPERAFTAAAAGDLLAMVAFTRWIGVGAVLVVLLLVANAVALSVRARVQEHAVLRTLGFQGRHLAMLVLLESGLLALGGALAGLAAGAVTISQAGLAMANEGRSIAVAMHPATAALAVGAACLLAVAAAAVPAWRAATRPMVAGLRS